MSVEIKIIDTNNITDLKPSNTYLENRRAYYEHENNEIELCIMAYNKLEKTKYCVDSVMKYTNHIQYKLILIDNGSSDGTLEYFKSIPYENKIIIHITKNLSGVHADDVIMRYVSHKYCVILTNDSVVTANWLDNMLACMESDSSIGMVCPGSSNVSNGQQINIGDFETLDEMQKLAAEFNKSNPSLWEERLRLIPLAGLYRREIFDTVGIFDIGFYHDFGEDDFAVRLRRAGYKMMLCKDTFVHHNHPLTERVDEIVKPTDAYMYGRMNYTSRNHGIDAWEDVNSFMFQLLHSIDVDTANQEERKILGIDVKCGSPLLDLKNYLRKNGILQTHIKSFIRDIKYYPDLCVISDNVETGEIQRIQSLYKEKEFDYIILNEMLNHYERPYELIKNLLSMLKEKGVIVFGLKNTYDYRTFLSCINWLDVRDTKGYAHIHLEDLIAYISQLGASSVNINTMLHPEDGEIRNILHRVFDVLPMKNGDDNEHIDRLCVSEFWICLEK